MLRITAGAPGGSQRSRAAPSRGVDYPRGRVPSTPKPRTLRRRAPPPKPPEQAAEALRRAKFKFPGRQKIVTSRNWGFTPYSRDDYVQWKREGRLVNSGVHATVRFGPSLTAARLRAHAAARACAVLSWIPAQPPLTPAPPRRPAPAAHRLPRVHCGPRPQPAVRHPGAHPPHPQPRRVGRWWSPVVGGARAAPPRGGQAGACCLRRSC
jgi:hypothetical protein